MPPLDASHTRTLVSAFRDTVGRRGDHVALRSSDGRIELTWREYEAAADRVAAGLAALGVGPGDTVALLMGNRPEWQLSDLGTLIAGGTPFSLYASAPVAQNTELLRRSGAKALIADVSLLDGFEPPDGLAVVEIDGRGDWGISFEQLQVATSPNFAAPRVEAEDLATLIYTSGTTGPPKGVELTHASILFMVDVFDTVVTLDGGRTISYLPHAHIVDRIVGHYLAIVGGTTVTTIASPMAVFSVLSDVRPTLFTSVPRIWQRLQAEILAEIRHRPEPGRSMVLEAIAAAEQAVELRQTGAVASEALGRQVIDADERWFAEIRKSAGLDAVEWFITGSAPLARATHTFFAALGMPLHDLWGLSETVAVATMSTPGDHHIGDVGRPVPGTEVRLADDGEVLVRGPHLARGYQNDPGATALAFDRDGWFRTGDVGRWDGERLVLVDRKKELMISAGGENMSPAVIEKAVAEASPVVSSAVVVGDARDYNVALIVPDFSEIEARLGVSGPPEAVVQNPTVIDAISHAVEMANARLSRAEKVRKHVVLTRPWSAESGELTPTLKLRRTVIEAHHAQEIDGMYQPTTTDRTGR